MQIWNTTIKSTTLSIYFLLKVFRAIKIKDIKHNFLNLISKHKLVVIIYWIRKSPVSYKSKIQKWNMALVKKLLKEKMNSIDNL